MLLAEITEDNLKTFAQEVKLIAEGVMEQYIFKVYNLYSEGARKISDHDVLEAFIDYSSGYQSKMLAWNESHPIQLKELKIEIPNQPEAPKINKQLPVITISAGTAIATLIAIVIGTFIAILYVNNKSKILKVDFKYFKLDKKILTQFLKTGIPIMIENCFLAGMHLLEVNVSNSTGVISNAGYGVAGKVEQMISIMSASITTMATVTVGQFIGIKRVKESINVMEQGLKISVIPTVLIFIVGFVLPRHICRIFVSSEEVISMAIIYLSAVRIAYIILPAKELLHGFIIGTGHTKFVLFSVGVSSIVEVVTILILKNTTVNNLTALGTGVLLWVITGLILDIIYFFSNRWQKDILKC